MQADTRFRHASPDAVRHRVLTTAALKLFTSRELVAELRDRRVIRGDHWLWLHPAWCYVTPEQEEPA